MALEGVELLREQVPSATVVGRHGVDCLLEVAGNAADALLPEDRPIVVALVDAPPDQREIYGEPYIGELELFVRGGLLDVLLYVEWFGPVELPQPDEIHPSAEVTGHAVLDRSRFHRGWEIVEAPRPFSSR